MGDDPILWLTELRDIVSLMSDTELPAVIHELGDSRWCQLVFLNVRKTASRQSSENQSGEDRYHQLGPDSARGRYTCTSFLFFLVRDHD